MLGWAVFYLPQVPTRPLFYAEKIWFMTWIMSQSLSFFVILTAALFACGKPRLLLSSNWQKSIYRTHNNLLMVQFMIFLTVGLVDSFELLLTVSRYMQLFHDGKYNVLVSIRHFRERPHAQELLLNTIVRVSQLITCFVIFGSMLIHLEERAKNRKKRSKAVGLIKKMKKIKELKWSENQMAGDDLVSEQTDCAFCIVPFELDDSVIQLKCHKNHIFHRSCFMTYLEHMRKEASGQPKCPFCKEDIKFQERPKTN